MDGEDAPSAGRTTSAGNLARAVLATTAKTPMSRSAGAAKLALALSLRPGHVVITGPDQTVAETLVAATERQLGAMRLMRFPASTLDVEALLGAVRDAARTGRVGAVVTDADHLDAGALERLQTGLDPEALARGRVRLVLLGGRALRRTLRDERLRALMADVCLDLDAPSAEQVATVQGATVGVRAERPSAPRGRFSTGRVGLVALAAVIVIGTMLWMRPGGDPAPDVVVARLAPPAVAEERTAPPAVTEAPTTAPPAVAEAPATTPPAVAETPSTAPPPAQPSTVRPTPAVDAATTDAEQAVDAATTDTEPAPAAVAPKAAPRPGLDVERRPDAAAVTAPDTSLPPGSGLQVGAFADPANAERLAARLRTRFEGVQVSTVTRGGRTLHRVRIVGFQSAAQRRAAARALAADGLDALPVR